MRRWFRSEIDSDKIALRSLALTLRAFGKSAKVDGRWADPIVGPIPSERGSK